MKIEKVIQKVTKKEPYFTALVRALTPVSDKDIPSLATDGENLYYNPKFLDELTDDEAAAVVLHETLHCAFRHMWRKDNKKQLLWNVATDYAINPIVDEVFKLPEGTLLDKKYYGMSAEMIYDQLKKEAKDPDEQGWCEKDHWHGDKDEDENSVGDKVKKSLTKEGRKKLKEAKWRKKAQSEQVKAKWSKLAEKTFLDNYGKAPNSVKRIIEKKFYVPTIDWSALVSQILSEDKTDYSFSSPDRRFLGADFLLPDLSSIDRVKDVVFAYDTSGSISPEDLRAYYMETLKLFDNFVSLTGWIAICDADLHHFGEISAREGISDFNFLGGGGTAFEPVFEEVERRDIKPKALFYFTDTEGSFPKDPGYPVFWLVRSGVGYNHNPHVPFGEIVKFMS